MLSIIYYKLKMMVSDKVFFAAMIIIPVFITLATGYALRHEKMGTIPLVIVNEDKTEDAGLLIKRLSEKKGLDIQLADKKEAAQKLKEKKVEMVFVIKKGFQKKLMSGDNTKIIDFIKTPGSYSADFTAEIAAGEVMRLYSNYLAANWIVKQYDKLGLKKGNNLFNEVAHYTDSFWQPEPLMRMEYYEMNGEKDTRVEKYNMPAATATSTGIIMVFIMMYIMFSSSWLIEERRNGTLKRLVAGMNALFNSYIANIFVLFISGMAHILIFALVIRIIFGVELFTGVMSYIVMSAYLLSVISISMLLSSLLKTPAQLQSTAPVLALMTGFIGGCFWNFVNIPQRIQYLARLTPQGWALEAVNSLIVNPGDINNIIFPLFILLLIPLILLPLSYIIIKTGIVKEKINV